MSGRQDVTRRIEPGILDIDLAKSALIVNYHIHAEVVDGNGKVLKSKSEDKQKLVEVDVDETTDLEDLAEHVVSTQKYIPAQKLPKVIKLLVELQEYTIKARKKSRRGGKHDKKQRHKSSKKSSRRKKEGGGASREGKDEDSESKDDGGSDAPVKELECSIDKLDEYQDHLYSEDYKVRCTYAAPNELL